MGPLTRHTGCRQQQQIHLQAELLQSMYATAGQERSRAHKGHFGVGVDFGGVGELPSRQRLHSEC